MSLFRHECWFCGHTSRQVDFLVSSAEYHARTGRSPWQCSDDEACTARRVAGSVPTQSRPVLPTWVGAVPIIEDWIFGQGSYGKRCRLCGEDNWSGKLTHRQGCPGSQSR